MRNKIANNLELILIHLMLEGIIDDYEIKSIDA